MWNVPARNPNFTGRATDLAAMGRALAAQGALVEGVYEVGMQDQAFMGPECGLAIPADDGGVELYVSTQWLHVA